MGEGRKGREMEGRHTPCPLFPFLLQAKPAPQPDERFVVLSMPRSASLIVAYLYQLFSSW